MLAPKNIPDEEKAWAIIILKAAQSPKLVNVIILAATNLMCATDE